MATQAWIGQKLSYLINSGLLVLTSNKMKVLKRKRKKIFIFYFNQFLRPPPFRFILHWIGCFFYFVILIHKVMDVLI